MIDCAAISTSLFQVACVNKSNVIKVTIEVYIGWRSPIGETAMTARRLGLDPSTNSTGCSQSFYPHPNQRAGP